MSRRMFMMKLGALVGVLLTSPVLFASGLKGSVKRIRRSDDDWKKILDPMQYQVLRKEGTERKFSSPLNNEKREGTYVCAGCDLDLFTSEMKYDSATGWPSFFSAIESHLETKRDFLMLIPRTEYHCARCGGHQGHIFNDGPKPSGQRWCNNGVALRFIPGPLGS